MKRLKFEEINLNQETNPIEGHRYIGMNGNTFSFKTSSGIIAQSITGSIGPQGQNGTQGPTGTTGVIGENGIGGATGPQGSIGSQGSIGTNGATGHIGPTGVDNNTEGPQGVTGPSESGSVGTQGSQGPTGSPSYLIYTSIVNHSSGTFTVYQLENTIGDGSADGVNDIEWQRFDIYGGYIFPVFGSGSVYTSNTSVITSSINSTASESYFVNYLGVFQNQFGLPDKVPALRFFRHDNSASSVPNFNDLYVQIKIYY